MTTLNKTCPKCGKKLIASIGSALHDSELLDIIVEHSVYDRGKCDWKPRNAFLSIEKDMVPVE